MVYLTGYRILFIIYVSIICNDSEVLSPPSFKLEPHLMRRISGMEPRPLRLVVYFCALCAIALKRLITDYALIEQLPVSLEFLLLLPSRSIVRLIKITEKEIPSSLLE